MNGRAIVTCNECGQAYVGRERDDGSFVLPTTDGRCRCGEEVVDRFDSDEQPVPASQ